MKAAFRTGICALVATGLLSCGPGEEVACEETAPRPSGLRPLGEGPLDAGRGDAGHARELVLDGDLVFLADANGLPILRSAPSGDFELLHGIDPENMRRIHCSTAALHAPSRTLVCAAGDSRVLDFIDVSDPARPFSRPQSVSSPDLVELFGVYDVAVSGDTLWLAANRQGLVRMTLGTNGKPVAVHKTGLGEDTVSVVPRDGRLFVLDRRQGLVVYDEGSLEELARTQLDGPPLDLEVDGSRVAVALGSEGVRLLSFEATGLTVERRIQPKCVTTGAALSGEALAVTCLSGVYLYDLRGEQPRLAGFVPSPYGMLDVAFGPHGLVVADWFRVLLFEVDLSGTVTVPDVPRAMRLQPGADARVAVRNPLDEPMNVGWALQREGDEGWPIATGTLPLEAGGEAVLTLPADQLEDADSTNDRADVVFFREGDAPSCGRGGLVSKTRVQHRLPTDEPERGRAAVGDPFPLLRRTGDGDAPDVLPEPGTPTLVMFLTVDCYLQWPQLEDMAWLQRHRPEVPAPLVLYLTTWNEDPFDPTGFMRNYDALDLFTVEWADYAGSVPGTASEPNPVRAFETTFAMALPGADFPHDYVIDAQGIVRETSRLYRGRWPLLPRE